MTPHFLGLGDIQNPQLRIDTAPEHSGHTNTGAELFISHSLHSRWRVPQLD